MRAISYFTLILVMGMMLFPFLWMFSTSVKPLAETFSEPPYLLPRSLRLDNFAVALSRVSGVRVFLNSGIYVVGCMLPYLFISCLAGFAFAKYTFAGKTFFFLLILATLMIPIETIIVPLFVQLKAMGWLNTYPGMIVPRIVEPFGIFLLRQHFQTIPDDLLDAARIDGMSDFKTVWKLFVPLSKAPLAVLAIFMFLWRWNDLIWPLSIGSKEELHTVQVAIALFNHGRYIEWNLLIAMCVLAIVPGLILFLSLQKYFIQGVVMSGLKI